MTGRAGEADRAAGEGPPADAESRGGRRTYVMAAVVAAAVVAATAGTAIVQAAQDPAARSVSAYGGPRRRRLPARDHGRGRGPGEHDRPRHRRAGRDPGAVPDGASELGSAHRAAAVSEPAVLRVGDTVRVEQLVHNLAYGYTVLWYDPALPSEQRDQLSDLATAVRAGSPKLIAAPWDASRGRSPAARRSRWPTGVRRPATGRCRQVSGEAVAAFLAALRRATPRTPPERDRRQNSRPAPL